MVDSRSMVYYSFKKKKEKITDRLTKIHGVLKPKYISRVYSQVKSMQHSRPSSARRPSSQKKSRAVEEVKELFAVSPLEEPLSPTTLNFLDTQGIYSI